MFGLTPLGVIHTAISLIAVAAGLIALVRDKGQVVDGDDLRESEVILPPPDLTLEEAAEEFSGEGLIPDPT